MPLVDVHCHLDAPAYHDVSVVCQHSRQAGVTVTVAAGTGLRSNARILALQEQESGQVWAALGLHPERLDASWAELEAVIAQVHEHRQRVVALGEIGLPHYALLDKRMTLEQAQEREAMLHTLVQAAVRLALPVVLHTPHAASAKCRWTSCNVMVLQEHCSTGTKGRQKPLQRYVRQGISCR